MTLHGNKSIVILIRSNEPRYLAMNKFIGKLIASALVFTTVFSSLSLTNVYADEYWPEGPEVQSQAAIVMEMETGAILYEKNINDVHYPASITKIMTTLLALENSDMNEVVTFSHDSVYNTEGSGIARDVGEEMTMEQCLYAVMLESANECAYAVGEHVADGDINKFVDMMNDRAAEIGCLNTHFNNSSGLPDDNHYTSAYDMALIAKEAYKNEVFRVICGTKRYTIPVTNKHKNDETYLQNHHGMLYPLKTTKYLYEYCLGGKTGYTTQANSTLVTYAEKDGMTLICVVMDAPSGAHYDDTRALFDYAFANFHMVNVTENLEEKQDIKEGAHITENEDFVEIDDNAKIVLPLAAEYKDATSEVVVEKENLDVAATLNYSYAGHYVGSADIKATNATIQEFVFGRGNETAAELEKQNAEEEKQKEEKAGIFQVDIIRILKIAGLAILAIALLIVIIVVFNSVAFRKRRSRWHQDRRYKTIKPNRKWNRRRR